MGKKRLRVGVIFLLVTQPIVSFESDTPKSGRPPLHPGQPVQKARGLLPVETVDSGVSAAPVIATDTNTRPVGPRNLPPLIIPNDVYIDVRQIEQQAREMLIQLELHIARREAEQQASGWGQAVARVPPKRQTTRIAPRPSLMLPTERMVDPQLVEQQARDLLHGSQRVAVLPEDGLSDDHTDVSVVGLSEMALTETELAELEGCFTELEAMPAAATGSSADDDAEDQVVAKKQRLE